MSLILDALRKIELERKAKRQGSVNLRSEVLNYRGTPSKKRNLTLPGVVAMALIVVAATLFFLLRSSPGPAVMTAKATSAQPQATVPDNAPGPAPVIQPQAVPAVVEKIPSTPEPRPLTRVDQAARPAAPAAVDSGNLAVTGIAWQEERNMRRAVINGALLGEGAEILGARIVEIRENRVRFSRGNETFEVAYPAAGR